MSPLGCIPGFGDGIPQRKALRLLGWTASTPNQILFHNQAMQACRLSIREISGKRALFNNGPPPEASGALEGPPGAQPVTPPEGLQR